MSILDSHVDELERRITLKQNERVRAENLALFKHEAETPTRGHDANGECCLRARLEAIGGIDR